MSYQRSVTGIQPDTFMTLNGASAAREMHVSAEIKIGKKKLCFVQKHCNRHIASWAVTKPKLNGQGKNRFLTQIMFFFFFFLFSLGKYYGCHSIQTDKVEDAAAHISPNTLMCYNLVKVFKLKLNNSDDFTMMKDFILDLITE